jgi:hypothetical protein
VPDVPQRLVGDTAYDSDGLDHKLMEKYGTEMIARNRAKRKQTQEGRPLRRHVRNCNIERMFTEGQRCCCELMNASWILRLANRLPPA